ncbi:16S rRNA (cytosine(967)-C(5))-methyltransferase RsmB [Sporomusa termitida]|uniref:16S rRNA (cytosine(967)-C(5))-methyltransferase n=1 Tax=Sporomusa termitida TaxID=2377 RepID=A0A517DTJ2_9FIRM|nr:16S rRNA (cytosine(967)-C(5))-methyltransferase RsmB [Sporomusa termitida]QDR80674.1 Ribosomal RNA small subunit methyltransferase B [Sporomusa termitida]
MTTKKNDAREIALKVINDIETNGAYANIALNREINRQLSQGQLSDQDRRFITELVYGTVKAGATLDWMLSSYLSRPLTKVAPVIRNILRLGMYQLFFLEKVPASAACNQAVELTKKYGHAGTVKFVNGVLRNAARSPEKIVYPDPDKQPVQYLALKYFHPEWLITRWVARLGAAACQELCQLNNTTPPLSIRTNTVKTSRPELLQRLTDEGVTCELSDWAPEGIICYGHPGLNTLASLRAGLFQVQDESSMVVAHILDPQPGEFIIDACGAPGGKTTHIAALMNNTGKVLSTDIYEHKLALTRENASRLGLTNIETRALDAVNLDSMYPLKADRVLVDAPCSGLGVLRRKPDSRWRKTEDILQDLPRLQSAILASAARCVKPGGVLVYSTCTTEPEENQDIVQAFLQVQPQFSLETTGQYLPGKKRPATMLQLWPHTDGVDGFFIARMRRQN